MIPTRSLAHVLSLRFLSRLSLVLGALLAVSCQTESDDPQPAPAALYRVAIPELPVPWGDPDWGVIRVGGDSAVWPVSRTMNSMVIELDAPPTDTARLTLWRGGVLVYEIDYLYIGSTELRQASAPRPRELALEVFERIQPASSHDAFVEAFASMLVANDSLVRDAGFPARVPVGTDSAEVIREALEQIVARDTSLSVLLPAEGRWALGLDSAAVVQRVRALVRSGAITADTATLFAPPIPPDTTGPVLRFVSPSSDSLLAASLERIDASVRAQDPSGVDSVWIGGRLARGTDSVWTVAGIVLDSADTLVPLEARARDRRGNVATTQLLLRRLRRVADPDTTGPDTTGTRVVRQSGPFDTTVAAGDSTARLVWIVRSRGLPVTVTVNGARVAGMDDVYAVTIPLDIGENRVFLQARDSLGLLWVDSVRIVRLGSGAPLRDTLPPTVVREPGTRPTTVDDTATEFVAAWRVRDASGLASVVIQGVQVSGVEGLFTRRIALAYGTNVLGIVARDSAGNATWDSIVVERRRPVRDTSGPPVVRRSGPFDTTVIYVDSVVNLVWFVRPRATPVRVHVLGMQVEGVDGLYSARVPVRVGVNDILFYASDSLGRFWVDSVRIERWAPQRGFPPSVARQAGTTDTTVDEAVTSFQAAWSVSAASGLESVTIQGIWTTGANGVFSRQVPLALGSNVVRIVARDSAGQVRRDSIRVRRATGLIDTVWTFLERQPGTKDTSVPNTATSYTVGWKVRTRGEPRSVTIGGFPATGVGGVYAKPVPLMVGLNTARIVVVDSQGNTASDSVAILRQRPLADVEAPTIVRQAGTQNATVPNDVREFRASWRVRDASGLRSVRVLGGVQVSEGEIHTCVAALLEGPNVLRITAVDSAGNMRSDTVVIWRTGRAEDRSRPYIVREPGTADTVLDFAFRTVALSWRVEPTGLPLTVTINGQTVMASGGIYTANVSMSGSDSRKVFIVARDSLGLVGSDTVRVSRPILPPTPKDSIPPTLARQPGTRDTVVEESVTEYVVAWHVTDSSGLAMVQVASQLPTPVAGVYSARGWLARGPNVFRIVARDSAGNEIRDSIVVTRLGAVPPDTVPRYVFRQPGTQDTTVGNEVAFARVSWLVRSRGTTPKVSINGTLVTGVAGVFSAVVPLDVGLNAVRIKVTDSAGTVGADTVRILRSEATLAATSSVVSMPGTLVAVESSPRMGETSRAALLVERRDPSTGRSPVAAFPSVPPTAAVARGFSASRPSPVA